MISNRSWGITLVIMVFFTGIYRADNEEVHSWNQERERPLKILFVVGCFPLLPETFILNQLTGLIDRGHDISIYAFREGQKKIHPDVIKYNLFKRTYYGNLPPDIASYDIILCQFGPLGKRFLKIKKELNLKAKLVTCFRGYDISKEVKEKGKDVYKHLFAQGDLFLPVCHYFKNIMIDLGCDPNKIIVHHSAINLDKFSFKDTKEQHDFFQDTTGETLSEQESGKKEPNKELLIVSVNRLVPKKGTIYGINAIRSLVKKYPILRYKIMGNGRLKNSLAQVIQKGKVGRIITLLGWGTQDDVIKLLKKADIFVLPSVTASDGNEEGIPNALKEAMAMGIPVVSTYHAGIAELIKDEVTGFLVPSADSKALAKKIEYLINNPEVRHQMGIAARKHVEQEHDTHKLNDRLIDIFYKLLNKKEL